MPSKTQKDPVCGMEVKGSKTKEKAEHKGETYFFCSAECKHEFEKKPEQYAKGANPSTK